MSVGGYVISFDLSIITAKCDFKLGNFGVWMGNMRACLPLRRRPTLLQNRDILRILPSWMIIADLEEEIWANLSLNSNPEERQYEADNNATLPLLHNNRPQKWWKTHRAEMLSP